MYVILFQLINHTCILYTTEETTDFESRRNQRQTTLKEILRSSTDPPGKRRDSTLDHNHFLSCAFQFVVFNHPIIRRYMLRPLTASINKVKENK
jgi:hypothetical protein